MRFKPGQKVVCVIKGKPWHYGFGPEYNEVVTVLRACECGCLDGVKFVEYLTPKPGEEIAYMDCDFEPLIDITELTEILEQQPEHA